MNPRTYLAPVLRRALGVIVLWLWSAAVSAEPALPASSHRYELEATLDEVGRRVDGRVRIRFRNTSARALDALIFHLYMNAFRDAHSVFMRESGGALRDQPFRGPGSIELASLTIAGKDALARSERELVAGDHTQLRVQLAEPLAPGGELEIESQFAVKLPPAFARAGYAGDFFVVAQWFPKLAKLEPDGHFESFPYHGLGEFYADFADYALELTTAGDFQVVASGALVHEAAVGAQKRYRFFAPHVHDLAFVAARGFHLRSERVDGVLVRYLAPPHYERALSEHARTVRAGLARFGRAFGRYPYPALSVVVPSRQGAGAAGMEYPSLILSDGDWFAAPRLASLSGAFVTAHELAHQWFYGLIANDEVRFPVLDEGLAQWAALDLTRAVYGAHEGLGGPLSVDRFEVERALAVGSIASGLAAHEYTRGEYGASVYARAALALESIRRAHGAERFARALSLYAASQRFRHPSPRALEAAFEQSYGPGFAERVVRPLLFGADAPGVQLARTRSARRGARYLTQVRARRTGAVALPTWLALYAADGRELTRVPWPSERASLSAELETREPVARAVLDPERALLLDPRVSDQVAVFSPPSSSTFVARALALAQLVCSWLGP